MRLFTYTAVLYFVFLFNIYSQGLTGAKTIGSGGDYTTIASAISDLNSKGVGTDGVTFQVPAGYTETFTSVTAGLITATGTVDNPIVFEKTGTGDNPVIISPHLDSDNIYIIKIEGGDYITWDGIDLKENRLNINLLKASTYGFWISNKEADNPAQYNIIQNCSITLDKTEENEFASAIYQYCYTPPTSNNENSYNTYKKITINSAKNGIILRGSSLNIPIMDCLIDSCIIGDSAKSIRQYGIKTIYSGSTIVSNNTIKNIYNPAFDVFGIIFDSAPASSFSYTNSIFNNKIFNLTCDNNTGSSVTGISIANNGNQSSENYVYNNMISELNNGLGSQSIVLRVIGIKFVVALANNYVYNNTVSLSTGINPSSACLLAYYGKMYIKNNLLINKSTEGATSIRYCIYKGSSATLIESNYNDFNIATELEIPNNYVGYYSSARRTLANWQGAQTGIDINSTNTDVTFVSSTDLHLFDTSIGDENLTGTTLDDVTTDIDGETRHSTKPYMGADENAHSLPVELSSFEAHLIDGNVLLNWTTATEINCFMYEIERTEDNSGNWLKIGDVPGNGTVNNKNNYSYIDHNITFGTYYYRLKQIDTDGNYKYTNEINILVGALDNYELMQNYPNPFNPETTIRFTVPKTSHVHITVYDILGKQVATLINEEKEAGSYTIRFDAGNLASGIYFYRIITGSFVDTKKMMLIR